MVKLSFDVILFRLGDYFNFFKRKIIKFVSWCINILGENSNEWYFRNGSFKLYDWIDGEWNFELNIQWSVFKNEDLEDGASKMECDFRW